MKVKIIGKIVLILLLVITSVLFTISCSPETVISGSIPHSEDSAKDIASKDQLLSSYKNNSSFVSEEEYSSPLKKELEGLRYVLSPYLSYDNPSFIGNDNKEFIEDYFLNSDISNLSMSAADWERAVRILLEIDDKEFSPIKTYITDFIIEDKIEREHALAGLMNLLSLRYPSLSLDPDNEDIQKSVVITDLDIVEEENKALISKAFRLGFTDFSVDKSRLFRPDDFLNRAEAISIFYRILTNLGMPAKQYDLAAIETADIMDDTAPINLTQEAYSVEDILDEYVDYRESLKKSRKKADETKLEMLKRAESILNIDYESQISKTNIDFNTWIYILTEVFEIDSHQIESSDIYKKVNTLTYDIAAISIFDLLNLIDKYNTGDVNEKELITAREAIPQFDTAEDIYKFASIYSSELLEGIRKIPGFTPKRPVNNSEALLLIMRIVKGLSI